MAEATTGEVQSPPDSDEQDPLNAAVPCDMFTQEPFDFAWCEPHDQTFPLGGICRFHPKAPKTEDTSIPSQTQV